MGDRHWLAVHTKTTRVVTAQILADRAVGARHGQFASGVETTHLTDFTQRAQELHSACRNELMHPRTWTPARRGWLGCQVLAAAVIAALLLLVAGPKAHGDAVPAAPYAISNPALSWSCDPHPIYIDEASAPSPWHVDVVRDALAQFARATGRSWPITSDPNAAIRIRWYDSTGHKGALTALSSDSTHYLGADMQLSPAIDRYWFQSSVLHELGHLGGLAHVHDDFQVMGLYPSLPFTHYGPGDLQGLAVANRGCSDGRVATTRFRPRLRMTADIFDRSEPQK
jgi:hypothetical protein